MNEWFSVRIMEEDSSLGWAPMAPEEMDFSAFSTTFPTDQFTADHTQQLEAAPAAVMAQLPTQPVPVQQVCPLLHNLNK